MTSQKRSQRPGNAPASEGKHLLLAASLAVVAATTLSGCAWFHGRHPDQTQTNAHMNDFNHDHQSTDSSMDRHDDQHVNDGR